MRRGEGLTGEGRERVVDEELSFHLAERTAELEAEGRSPEEARRQAEREFGDLEATRAYCERQDRIGARRRRVGALLRAAGDDARHALRAMARSPRAVGVPLLVLTVGIALNTLVFTVVRSVLLAPLPFEGAERLYAVEEVREGGGFVRASYPVLARWRTEATGLEAVAGYTGTAFPVTTADGPLHVEGAAVSEGFLGLLDQPILMGRDFTAVDHRPAAEKTVILSERFWRRLFADGTQVGDVSLRMNGVGYRVLGVVRNDRIFPDGADLWVPVEQTYPEFIDLAGASVFEALGRARAGVESAVLEPELARLATEVEGGGPGARATPAADRLLGDVRTPLLLLQGAVLLVLLAACANAGGMLLTRSVRRSGELAVQISLGAARSRVFLTLLYEGLLLGVAGGAAGLVIAWLLLEPTLALVPRELPRADVIRLDPTVVVVALALAAVTGVASAFAPALASARLRPASLVRQGSGSTGSAPWLRRLLDGLVVGQVALAMLLTAGAALLVRSFVATLAEDPGFDPAQVTVLDVSLPDYSYQDDAARLAFAHELLERAASIPGTESVALGRNLPIRGSNMTSPLVVEGAQETTSSIQVAMVTEAYFDVMRIDLLRGTGFDGEDREGGTPRMIVDEGVLAPDGSALDVGDRAHSFFGSQETQVMRDIVGVVRPVRHHGLREQPTPIAYRPFFQAGGASAFSLLVRSEAPTGVVAEAARALLRDIDPDLPNDRVASMSSYVRRSLVEPRFYTVGLTAFGVLALVLALAGCQAGLAHRVAARRRELGLRMALGASSPAVRAMVRTRGVALTAVGAALGLAATLPAGRVLESQLYGVAPTDPLTLGAVFVLLLAAGALASDLPARRAASVDPAGTLREA